MERVREFWILQEHFLQQLRALEKSQKQIHLQLATGALHAMWKIESALVEMTGREMREWLDEFNETRRLRHERSILRRVLVFRSARIQTTRECVELFQERVGFSIDVE